MRLVEGWVPVLEKIGVAFGLALRASEWKHVTTGKGHVGPLCFFIRDLVGPYPATLGSVFS